MRSMLKLPEVNAMKRDEFVVALGHLFEHSPWVAEETWRHRPFPTAKALHSALCAAMRRAPRDRQLALIRAHPDLAGRLAQQRKLTEESSREQASAGLDRLPEEELAEFTRLNEAYRAKFGFPFIICARLNAREAILAAMKARGKNSLEDEFAAALGEIEKIAWLRLQDMLGKDRTTTDGHR